MRKFTNYRNNRKSKAETSAVGEGLKAAAAALAAAQGASMFHVLLTALYVYFSSATGHHDIVGGVPILNRSSARFKRMVGLFTDITPARLQLTPETSGADAIGAIHD